MDYMFLTENQETLTVAVVVDKASGSIGATAVSHKGPEKSGVDYIATWLETFGYRQFEVHTDGEASSIACMRAAVSKYAATFPEEERERGSSSSAGSRRQTLTQVWEAVKLRNRSLKDFGEP